MRLRSRLLFLTLAVLLPASIGSAIVVGYAYWEQREFVQTNMRETARALAQVLDREMRERENVLRALATSPALEADDTAAFYPHARSVAARYGGVVILSDGQGRQLVNTRLPLGAPLPQTIAMERQMRAEAAPGSVLISNIFSPPSGRGAPSFAVQVPVQRTGEPRFLSLVSPAGDLQQVFVAQSLPDEWLASIVDRNGNIVARSKEPERFVGTPVRPELREALMRVEGSHGGQTLGGVPSVAFFSQAPRSQWTFLVAVPESVLRGSAVRAAELLGGVVLLLLGLAVLAAFAVGRATARPMEALRLAAERLGRNEAVQPQASGILEIDDVNAAMVRAGERLRDANAELERKVAEAVAGYQQSQRALLQAQKLEALGRLTGGIAHDFNNVLQTLTTGLQAAQRDSPETVRKLLAVCQRAVGRGAGLARQLAVFGRVQDVRRETIDLRRRMAEARPLLGGALPSNVTLDYDLAPDIWPVTADPAQLELALLNLVINARDAMPGGGSIVLRGANLAAGTQPEQLPQGDYVSLAVADDGEGMSEEVLARAFDPFFTTKSVGQGSGMGLAQAYGFAGQSGGTLLLASRSGEGTTATLLLPRAAQAAALPAERTEPVPSRGRGRVLLVEDDPLVRDTVREALQAAGFELQVAGSGDEALNLLQREQAAGPGFDVVFSDVVMPGALSGVDLAQRVAQRHPGLKVVLATGYSDRSIDLPGVRALAKPYDLQQAVDALNDAVAEGS